MNRDTGNFGGVKYLLNSGNNVRDNLVGLAMTTPSVQIVDGLDAIVRKDFEQSRSKGLVLLVSGGGAGHEPMFAGFVGPKRLSAAISGQYFASPSAGNIMKLVEQIADHQTKVLMIQANYTGDRLNFGLAKEYLTLKGFQHIGWFVFGDDLAPYLNNVPDDEIQSKRRGLAGIAFIHRIAGVLSDQGESLKEIQAYLGQCSRLIFTLSISLSAANIPGHGESFQLGFDQMELGLGAHGESGIQRIPVMSARETVQLMLNKLIGHLNDTKEGQLLDRYDRRIALIVNNLGGLITMEMNIILKEVVQSLCEHHHVRIERLYHGPVFTSFNMKGVSFSVLLVDDLLLQILDESDQIRSENLVNEDYIFKPRVSINTTESNQSWNEQRKLFENICNESMFVRALKNACQAIITNESFLNKLDETIGDSDCGSTLSSIGKLFLAKLDVPSSSSSSSSSSATDNHGKGAPTFATLAQMVMDNIGGTSGAIYSILFTASHYFIETYPWMESTNIVEEPRGQDFKFYASFWLQLLEHCIRKISMYGGAKINDRSMIDGLHGIVLGLKKHCENPKELLQTIVDCAWTQAKLTAQMKANVGRAAYVDQTLIQGPDAGAYAVAIWTEAICSTLMDN